MAKKNTDSKRAKNAKNAKNSKTTKAASKPKPVARPAEAKLKKGRASWFDDKSQKPVIETYARQLESFLQTMADGVVEPKELEEQEARVVALMKEVEPQLNDEVHAKVTQLLCELTAYDIMQMVHSFQEARPKSGFRG